MAGFKSPRIPDFADLAILLDIDGTILEIAPTPQQVVVPAMLRKALTRLGELTEGALALVSGRALDDLDRLFAPLRLPAVAGHGAEFRLLAGTGTNYRRVAPLDPSLKKKFLALAEIGPGVTVEDKDYAVAVHYRLAPEKESTLHEAVDAICADQPSIEILPGKSVIEIKAAGFSKATGVRKLMTSPPFAGRRPIFIGDDTTDEYVFAIMPEFDGLAFAVGESAAEVDGRFDGPTAVRDWLAALAGITDAAVS